MYIGRNVLLFLLWCDSLSTKYDVSVGVIDRMQFNKDLYFNQKRCDRHINRLEQFKAPPMKMCSI